MRAKILLGYATAAACLLVGVLLPAGCSSKSADGVSAAVATHLSITTQPSTTVTSSGVFTVQPSVQLRDAGGNAVSTAGVVVTAAIASGTGTLGGSTTATTNASGVATFANLSITGVVGNYTLTFTAGTLTSITSTPVAVAAGAATQLTVTTQPSASITSALVFVQQPVVQLRDAGGNAVGTAGVVVTAAVASGVATLGGTLTATTNASGAATFTNLALTGAAGNATLGFSSPGLTSATSGTLAITAPALPSLAGTWAGSWTDLRYGVTGTITNVILTQSATAFGGTGTIDLSQLALGTQSGTATGTISGSTVTFNFTAAGIGSGSGTLAGNAGTGTGNITALNFGAFTFTGTASSTQITGTFQFTSPTGGNGTITVTKQ